METQNTDEPKPKASKLRLPLSTARKPRKPALQSTARELQERFVIRHDTDKATPAKKSRLGLGQLFHTPPAKPQHTDEHIDDSGSDDEAVLKPYHSPSSLKNKYALSPAAYQAAHKPEQLNHVGNLSTAQNSDAEANQMARNWVGGDAAQGNFATPAPHHAARADPENGARFGAPSALAGKFNSEGTPISAQRQFLASHMKLSNPAALPSSAVRRTPKKGFGPQASHLQRLLKAQEATLNASQSQQVSAEVLDLRTERAFLVTKCRLDSSMLQARDLPEEAVVVYNTEPRMSADVGSRIRFRPPWQSFMLREGLMLLVQHAELAA